ncbi:MAG: 16S rRNA (cytosine(1402)-N(4))-methyltransferase RsmH [Actinomycetota bacterium]|nr:16S rRNA (cytosine(1402)-N(4))-methyltransferase RsmH [Actinomycetota bacterium]
MFANEPYSSKFASHYHSPVLWREVADLFSGKTGVIFDATLGGGGHSDALLTTIEEIRIIGFDRDPEAIGAATERLARFGDRFVAVNSPFSVIGKELARGDFDEFIGEAPIAGVLADLGVSSRQFDDPARGFSIREGGPLDMRMSANDPTTAAELLELIDQDDLARLIAVNGERRFASRIAKLVKEALPISSTAALVEVVEASIPKGYGHVRKGAVVATFQALRIAVNRELDELDLLLTFIDEELPVGSVAAIISYHSGEDERVKRAFRVAVEGNCTCPPRLPCVCGATKRARYLLKRVMPRSDELKENSRSRSARLRAIEITEEELVRPQMEFSRDT